jgi:hypothetical protein
MKLALSVIDQFEREARGLAFGGVSIIAQFRNGKPTFRIEKVVSIVSGGENG